MDIYWEKQRGGLCRLHSINAYFGRPEISESEFNEAVDKFDADQLNKFGEKISCRSFDYINSDQRNLVTFILASRGIYVRYIPYNHLHDENADYMNYDCFFVFNLDHIWIVKKIDNVWKSIDSMNGINSIDPGSIKNQKNIGLMIPIKNTLTEFCRLGKQLQEIIGIDIVYFITKKHEEKRILGEAEQCMGIMVEVLRVQSKVNSPPLINRFIDRYDEFIRKMVISNNRTNLKFLLDNVPQIVRTIMSIYKVSICDK